MNRIKIVSRIFRILFLIAFFAFPLVVIAYWINAPISLGIGQGLNAIYINLIPAGIPILHPLSAQTKLLGFCISLLPTAAYMFLFYYLTRLFRLYEHGNIFSVSNVRYLNKIGITLFISQIIHPLFQFLMSMAMTWHNPTGFRFAEVTFTGTNFTVMIISLIVILISWIMAEGHKLQEESEFTI